MTAPIIMGKTTGCNLIHRNLKCLGANINDGK